MSLADIDSGARLQRAQRRALRVTLGANAAFFAVEVAGGIAFSSLALLADALHMLTDVAGLSIALVAQHLLTRPASDRHTYGLRRAEVLGAQVNGLILLASAGWIFIEGARRIGRPEHVAGVGVIVVGILGLLVNLVSAAILLRVRGTSLNLRAAFLHMALDAAGSVAVIAAGVAVLAFDAHSADPIASIGIGVLVIISALGLLRDTTHVLLEGTPAGLSARDVQQALASTPGVEAVHHLHLWDLASDAAALSAHVVLAGARTLHDAQAESEALKAMLAGRFGISHATLELECHECETPDHEHA